MGMNFTITLTGDISVGVEASDLSLGDGLDGASLFDNYRADISDVSVYGTVTVSARASLTGIEVEAADMVGFDADQRLGEELDPYGGVSADSTEVEVEDGPTGYTDVLAALGYDEAQAIAVYAALAAAGFEVI